MIAAVATFVIVAVGSFSVIIFAIVEAAAFARFMLVSSMKAVFIAVLELQG